MKQLNPNSVQVREELAKSRKKVTDSVDALRGDLKEGVAAVTAGASQVKRELKLGAEAIKRGMNWKTWVAKHPWHFMAGGVVFGLLLGTRRRL